MKKIILTLFALFAMITGLQAQTVVSLRVMSMNIKEGGKYISCQSKPFADLINEYKPDVIALQEVDYKTTRNGKRDWLNEVSAQTGMFPYYCKSISYQGGAFGTALLSKYPFFKAEKTVFKHKDAREDRATGWIYIQLPSGESIRVGTVHLSLESSQLTIQHFASINKSFFSADTVTPSLLIGDYNAGAGSDPINYVKNKWQEIIPNMGLTIPSDKPTTQLDYIMGYPKGAWVYTDYEIIARPDLSDHCFIVADLQINIR